MVEWPGIRADKKAGELMQRKRNDGKTVCRNGETRVTGTSPETQ